MRFNTAIARLMEMANGLAAAASRPREVVETFVRLLAPFAPHIVEELWSKLGHKGTLASAPWPSFDPVLAQEDTQEYAVQVNGEVRHCFRSSTGLDAAALLITAKADSVVAGLLDGKAVVKEIAIPGAVGELHSPGLAIRPPCRTQGLKRSGVWRLVMSPRPSGRLIGVTSTL